MTPLSSTSKCARCSGGGEVAAVRVDGRKVARDEIDAPWDHVVGMMLCPDCRGTGRRPGKRLAFGVCVVGLLVTVAGVVVQLTAIGAGSRRNAWVGLGLALVGFAAVYAANRWLRRRS